MTSDQDQPERPRREPEIIPPGKEWPGRDPAWPPNDRFGRTTHRVYVGRIGLLGVALLMLIVFLFGSVLLLALIGAALIWFPVLLLFLIIAAIGGLIRRL